MIFARTTRMRDVTSLVTSNESFFLTLTLFGMLRSRVVEWQWFRAKFNLNVNIAVNKILICRACNFNNIFLVSWMNATRFRYNSSRYCLPFDVYTRIFNFYDTARKRRKIWIIKKLRCFRVCTRACRLEVNFAQYLCESFPWKIHSTSRTSPL